MLCRNEAPCWHAAVKQQCKPPCSVLFLWLLLLLLLLLLVVVAVVVVVQLHTHAWPAPSMCRHVPLALLLTVLLIACAHHHARVCRLHQQQQAAGWATDAAAPGLPSVASAQHTVTIPWGSTVSGPAAASRSSSSSMQG